MLNPPLPPAPDINANSGSLSGDLQVAATTRLIEALFASENRMRLRIDLLSEIVFEIDAHGRIVFLSRAWTHLMEVAADRVLGQRLLDFVVPADRVLFEALVADAPTAPAFRRPVIRLHKPDGEVLDMELSLVAIQDGGLTGALHDITVQRRVQLEHERLSLVANHTDNFVIITDGKGFIEWVNPAFTRFTGYTSADLLGRKPGHVLQGPASDPAEIARISAALKSGDSFSGELVNYTKDRRPYWTKFYVTPIHDADGRIVRLISVQNDSSDMHKIRDQLEQARLKAEDASRTKSQFLSAMSHEIRTPINGVLGITTLLLDCGLNATQRHYAELIASSGNSLLAIINDVLDFSKVEAGKLTLEALDFDLDELLAELVSIHGLRAREKSLSLHTHTEPNTPRFLRGDPYRLRQILNNLLGNACKFTQRGSVSLTVGIASADAQRICLRFEVTDTGIGIAPDKQRLLFQPFSQVDNSITRNFGGTGLGLAICKQLAELMQGTIELQSTEGIGSKFIVVLPFETVDQVRKPSAVPAISPDSRQLDARILIAEDIVTNQIVARGMLKKLGYHDVLVVSDGAQAVQAVQSEHFDIVLMDCQMPVMDGYSATTRLRELGFEMPVVALTANAMRSDRELCLAAGMNDHLAKPVLLKQLAAVMNQWLPVKAALRLHSPADVPSEPVPDL